MERIRELKRIPCNPNYSIDQQREDTSMRIKKAKEKIERNNGNDNTKK